MSNKSVAPNIRAVNSKAKALLAELQRCCGAVDGGLFRIGKIINEIRDESGLSLREIKGLINTTYSIQRLAEFAKTAIAFPVEDRQQDMSFFAHEQARKLAAVPCMKKHKWTPQKVLGMMQEKGLTTKGAAKREILQRIKKTEKKDARKKAEDYSRLHTDIQNSVHNNIWEEVVADLPSHYFKLVIADPPFGAYTRSRKGLQAYLPDVDALRSECDNGTFKEALETTLHLFEILPDKMAEGGCLVVFQDGLAPDNPQILARAEECGWGCIASGYWVKSGLPMDTLPAPAPDRKDFAFGEICERILVFTLKGQDIPRASYEIPNVNLLFHAPLRKASAVLNGHEDMGDHHKFEKPVSLSEELIMRLTEPGDVVFSPFGCTGTDAIAAFNTHRGFIYAESNETNFVFGVKKIDDHINGGGQG